MKKEIRNALFEEEHDDVCLICICNIEHSDAIWSCVGCFTHFHLQCIQQWIKDGSYKSQNPLYSMFNIDIQWTCPKCRKGYETDRIPKVYKCFCGNLVNPKYDPSTWIAPHSCGLYCDRKLKSCEHNCKILCHSGPCPPCPKMINISCFCGKSAQQVRRCASSNWSCGKTCGKTLNCNRHMCSIICHAGACLACEYKSLQPCVCGSNKVECICSSRIWQCDKVCGKLLSCKYHKCQVVCHAEPCSDCPYVNGVRTCPCGKEKYYGTACSEEVSCCGQTCDKILPCNLHTCLDRCHIGPCGQCIHLTVKSCRCGSVKKSMLCSKEHFTCDNKCEKFRNCGRHFCKKKCCDGKCNTCDLICGSTLNCRKHKCNSPCHGGMCYPCSLTTTLTCACGSTRKVIPCGTEKQFRNLACKKLCNKPSKCHHGKIQDHSCHFGDCPPCNLECGKRIDDCGHSCKTQCHDYQFIPLLNGIDIPIQENFKRNAPWDPKIKYQYLETNSKCPPCGEPVKILCLGEHDYKTFECHEAKVIHNSYSCGLDCGRLLKCTNHRCSIICHPLNQTSQSGDSMVCEVCERICELPRPRGCTHSCDKVWCHSPLPSTPTTSKSSELGCPVCLKMVKLDCYCQLNKVYVECAIYQNYLHFKRVNEQNDIRTSFLNEQERDKFSCKFQCPKLLNCGHPCPRICHEPPCLSSTTPAAHDDDNGCNVKVKIWCNCKKLKRTMPCCERQGLFPDGKLTCTQQCHTAHKTQIIKDLNPVKSQIDNGIPNTSLQSIITAIFAKIIENLSTKFAYLSLFVLFISIFSTYILKKLWE